MKPLQQRYSSGTAHPKKGPLAAYRLRLIGQPELSGPDGPVRITAIRAQAVLWYLSAQPRRKVPRIQLVDLLWDDCIETEGRNRLRTTLSRLRAELPVWPLCAEGDALWWDAAAGIRVDAAEFAALRQVADDASRNPGQVRAALSAAAALWQGPFLDGFHVPNSGGYDEWVLQERQCWDQEVLAVLSGLHDLDAGAGDWPAAVAHALAALKIAPLQESFHRWLMYAHYQRGDRAQALACYAACERLLRNEVGVAPDPKTVTLRDAIATGRLPRPATAAAPDAPPPPAQPVPPPAATPPDLFLVGRSQELDWIRQGLTLAWSGSGRVVLLHGEAGIGKSRLVRAVTVPDQTLSGGAEHRTLLIGHGYESAAGLPYAPFVEALTHVLPSVDLDRLSLAATWLAQVSRLVPDLAERVPGLPVPEEADGQSECLMYEAVARFLAALPSPLLMVVEDVHWADEATLQLLAYLARHPALAGCGILATARAGSIPERVERLLHDLQRQGLLEWLEVGALTAAEIGQFVTAFTGRPDDALAERVCTETRGNPLFAIEVIRSLQEQAGQHHSLAGALEALPIPPSVQEVIRGHLSRLPTPTTVFLAAAAIFPRPAPFQIIRQVSGLSEEEALMALEALLRSGILAEEAAGAGNRPCIAFRHDLIRRTVANSTSFARREALHRRTYDCLEQVAGPNPPLQMVEQLAHHATAGGRWEQGLLWSQRAASAAMQVYAYAAAVPLLEQALKCLEQLPPTPDRQCLGIDIRLHLHPVAFYSHPERMPEWVLPAIETAVTLGDEVRLARGRSAYAAVLIYQGAFREALSLLEQTLPTARASGQAALLGPVLRLLGAALALCGEFDRTLAVQAEAIPLQDELRYHLNQVTARAVVGGVLAFRGHLDEAQDRLTELEQRCRTKGDPAGLAHALAYRAAVWHLRGDWQQVAADSAEGLQLAREAAHPFHEFQAGIFRGPALAYLGDVEAAVVHQEANIALAHKLGTGFLLGLAHAALGETYLAAGRPIAAGEAAQTGVAIATRGGAPYDAAVCRVVWGRAAAAAGDRVLARNELQSALHNLQTLGARPYVGRCHSALAQVAETETEQAWHRQRAAEQFQAAGMNWDLRRLTGAP